MGVRYCPIIFWLQFLTQFCTLFLYFEVTEDPSKQLCKGVNVSTVADIKMATPWVVGPGQIPDRPPPRPEGQPVPPPELQVIT